LIKALRGGQTLRHRTLAQLLTPDFALGNRQGNRNIIYCVINSLSARRPRKTKEIKKACLKSRLQMGFYSSASLSQSLSVYCINESWRFSEELMGFFFSPQYVGC
jgi:hypothetical protein